MLKCFGNHWQNKQINNKKKQECLMFNGPKSGCYIILDSRYLWSSDGKREEDVKVGKNTTEERMYTPVLFFLVV